MKLNVGCGKKLKEGYLNVDIHKPCDVVHDLRNPLPYENVDEIYAEHVADMFTRDEWHLIKKDWVRTLRQGGRLEIVFPDMEYNILNFLHSKDPLFKWGLWLQSIYGGQEHEFDCIKNAFTYEKLKEDLEKEGMSQFEKKQRIVSEVHLICYKI